MKKLILLLIVFTSTHSFAQRAKNVFSKKSTPATINKSRDTSLRVIIVDKEKQIQLPAYFINDRFVQNFSSINAEQIESMKSEEHTSELQSRENLVCRLLLEKKKQKKKK